MLLTSYMGTRLARVVFILIVSIIFLSNVAFVYWTIRSQRCPVYTSPVYDAKKFEHRLNEHEVEDFLKWRAQKRLQDDQPAIYMITPTYARWTQKADLTSLCSTLMHVPRLVWIVVEDSTEKTDLVEKLLRRCSVTSVHLNVRTRKTLQRAEKAPRWSKHRGVDQRNAGLRYLRECHYGNGVVYFGDDDNTYSMELFEEMRWTEKVSVWPVGLSGGLKFEGPLCENGHVMDWHTMWEPSRPFPIDMAGFAVNASFLLGHPKVWIDPTVPIGHLETSFLSQLVTKSELEPKANMCKEVLVWHTRTEIPKMNQEVKLIEKGVPSNQDIEV